MRKVVVASTGHLCFVIPFFSLTGAPVPVWTGAMRSGVSAFASGTNARLAALKKQYVSRSSTMQMLEFEDMVG